MLICQIFVCVTNSQPIPRLREPSSHLRARKCNLRPSRYTCKALLKQSPTQATINGKQKSSNWHWSANYIRENWGKATDLTPYSQHFPRKWRRHDILRLRVLHVHGKLLNNYTEDWNSCYLLFENHGKHSISKQIDCFEIDSQLLSMSTENKKTRNRLPHEWTSSIGGAHFLIEYNFIDLYSEDRSLQSKKQRPFEHVKLVCLMLFA